MLSALSSAAYFTDNVNLGQTSLIRVHTVCFHDRNSYIIWSAFEYLQQTLEKTTFSGQNIGCLVPSIFLCSLIRVCFQDRNSFERI